MTLHSSDPQHTSTLLATMALDPHTMDLTLAGAGQDLLTAHQSVLAASSPLLARLLAHRPSQQAILVLPSLSTSLLHALVTYLYSGKVVLGEEQVTDFLEMSNQLQVMGITGESHLEKPSEIIADLIIESQLGESTDKHNDVSNLEENIKKEFEDIQSPQQAESVKMNRRRRQESTILKCDACEYQTNLKRNYKKHTLFKHSQPQKMCHVCDKSYFTVGHLNEHIKAFHDLTTHGCDLCDFKTNTERNLEKHIAKAHFAKTIPCAECPYSVHDKEDLNDHIAKSHTRKEDWPKCTDCDYTWWHKQNVANHIKKVHLKIRFTCQICSNVFTEKANLNAHMKKIHSDMLIKLDNPKSGSRFAERFQLKTRFQEELL